MLWSDPIYFSEATWPRVFEDLKDRGLKGVRYVVSDKHRGIEAAIARYFQGAVRPLYPAHGFHIRRLAHHSIS